MKPEKPNESVTPRFGTTIERAPGGRIFEISPDGTRRDITNQQGQGPIPSWPSPKTPTA